MGSTESPPSTFFKANKKSWLLGIFMTMVLLMNFSGFSQSASSYTFSESTEAFSAVVGTNSTATGDDGTQSPINIGFTFTFGGVNYTTFGLTTNGFLKLGGAAITSTGGFSNGLSNSATNNPLLGVFWDDNHRNAGSIQYLTSGVSPNQILEVSWTGVNIGGSGATSGSSTASYKIRLYETTNAIDFIYGTMGAAEHFRHLLV
ncbi:hypothetical protein [Flavobacterium sp. 3HN19-14]|uniref:hypothetical protein n=1 Tax=Flavobacterium sp. 3HN19-14 TaxID=3448133 RepID=UPI003EDEA971